jgi:ankyrin repeat protein
MSDIHSAARAGDLETVKALLKGNPRLVFAKDNDDHMPLHLAAAFGNSDVAELLLSCGADVNAKGGPMENTPLHMAASWGSQSSLGSQKHKDVEELLRRHGAHE